MPDEQPEPEVVLDEVEAETPPTYPTWQPHYGNHTPSISSPASPAMSLHSFIMSPLSPFSPMRRQFSASPELRRPSTAEHEDPQDEDDAPEEDKDILIQRLNDLASRLASGGLHGKEIESMHAQVDGLERMVDDGLKGRTLRPRDSTHSSAGSQQEHRGSFSRPLSPIWPRVRFDLPPSPSLQAAVPSLQTAEEASAIEEEEPEAPREESPHLQQLLDEARGLEGSLEIVLDHLRARQEEQEVIIIVTPSRPWSRLAVPG